MASNTGLAHLFGETNKNGPHKKLDHINGTVYKRGIENLSISAKPLKSSCHYESNLQLKIVQTHKNI